MIIGDFIQTTVTGFSRRFIIFMDDADILGTPSTISGIVTQYIYVFNY